MPRAGPLLGVRVIELTGVGPGPFAGMLLADMGAEVIEIQRRSEAGLPPVPHIHRGRRSMAIDLKIPEGIEVVRRLTDTADVLVDPYRPGVTERLGLGPDTLSPRNPRLIYARMTGWGQNGPWAGKSGHDINYAALAGALESLGREGSPPTPPINYLADLAGGAMFLAFGLAAALYERERSGHGQVLDVAMVDGVAVLTSFLRGLGTHGWGPRGTNLLDTGAPQYEVYQTSDGQWISVGCVEPHFFRRLLEVLDLSNDPAFVSPPGDAAGWRAGKQRMAEVFRTRTRDQWCALLGDDPDICYSPALTLDEAPEHPHLKARGTYVDFGGQIHAAPAPRFSRTPGALTTPPSGVGADTDDLLAEMGFGSHEIARLRRAGAVG
jgi:alpha-methylacyl-CoA racemase